MADASPIWLTAAEHAVVTAACERLLPPDPELGAPGAAALGVADYIDGLLGAFMVEPPRIWAGGPFSGRHGGDDGFSRWLPLRPLDELAWRTRIEGSRGRPEREINGPVVGLQERYRAGLAALGADFVDLDGAARDERLAADPEFRALLYEHCCEGAYGDPVYGGNRAAGGWAFIGFPGDREPRGYTDAEVSGAG